MGFLKGQVVEAARKQENWDWLVGRKGTSADWFRLQEGTLYLWGKVPCVAVSLPGQWVCLCDLEVKVLKAGRQLVSQSAIFQ